LILLVPGEGIEPPTFGLQNLPRHGPGGYFGVPGNTILVGKSFVFPKVRDIISDIEERGITG
jgi:hypothetical protein